MVASRLDGPRLCKGLSRMNHTMLGLERWSLADLRSVPDRLLGWLPDLLREVEHLGKWLSPLPQGGPAGAHERLGKWPTRLGKGYTALFPKEGP